MHKFIKYKKNVYDYDRFMNAMKFNINTKFYFLVGFGCMFILLLLYWLLEYSFVFFVGMYLVYFVNVVNRDVSFSGDKL